MLDRYDHTGVRYEIWPKVDTADAVTPVPVLALPQNFFRKRIFRKIQQMDFTSPSFLLFHRSAPQHRATARLQHLFPEYDSGKTRPVLVRSAWTRRGRHLHWCPVRGSRVTKARSPLVPVSVSYPLWRALNSLRPASLTGGARRCERVAAAVMTVSCCHVVMCHVVMWHVRDTSTVILWQVTLTISTSQFCPKLWLSSVTLDKCQEDKWWTN